jgi:hypothetical protein
LKAVRDAPRGLVAKDESLDAEANARRELAEKVEVGVRPNGRNLAAEAMCEGIDALWVCDVVMSPVRKRLVIAQLWELSNFYDGVAPDSGPPLELP